LEKNHARQNGLVALCERSHFIVWFCWGPSLVLSRTLSAGIYGQILFAVSPLLALGYVLFSAFESEEEEKSKRSKKADFNMEGHAE
jgi:hypothetical protein